MSLRLIGLKDRSMLKPQKDVTIYIYRRDGKKSEELLKSALEAYWDRPVLQLPKVERTDKGKPYFSEIPELHFSISHSGQYWACAFCRENVGLDLQECVGRIRETKEEASERLIKMAGRFFQGVEKDFVARDGFEHFFTVWAAREAYVKYTGQGIDRQFSDYCVIPKVRKDWSLIEGRTDHAIWKAMDCIFYKTYFKEKFVICVCTNKVHECRVVDCTYKNSVAD